jgi:HprK-related kinase A
MSDSIQSLGFAGFESRVERLGVGIGIGPFAVWLQARVQDVAAPLFDLYGDYPWLDADQVFSAHVLMEEVPRWGRRTNRRVRFTVDGRAPHEDLPVGQALAVFEWGLNLVLTMRFQRYLMLHAAVVERNGRALLLPAWPGHGKTTLCAALVHRGWRLLSDEFGLLEPGTVDLIPAPRPMPLKNQSIDVIRSFAPDAVLGPEIPNTRKGTVTHVRVPTESVRRMGETAPATWIVFPRWVAGAPLSHEPMPKAPAFVQLTGNAFNYESRGEAAFTTVRDLVARSSCWRLQYSRLEEAVEAFDRMAEGAGRD